MTQDQRDPEVLRQRLYRPGATAEDLESYLEVVPPAARTVSSPDGPPGAADDGPAEDGPARRERPARRRRALLVPAAAVALALGAAALGVGALGVGALAPAPPSAPPTAAAGWTAAPRDPGDSLVATVVLDGGRRAHASGRAVPSAGGGVLYTVAASDAMGAVAARFHLCTADVLVALPYGADPRKPPAGQRLLLERGAGTPARSC